MVLKRTQVIWRVAAVTVIAAAITIYLIHGLPGSISTTSPAYENVSRAFYHGLAALQVGLLDDARTQFSSATTIVPREPASWGNLGLTNLRLGDLDAANSALERAASLAPGSADIAFLQGQLEISRGRPAEAIAQFERGVRLDPRGLRIRYALAQEVESAGGTGADTRAQGLVDEILALSPDNVAAILERARLAAKRGDAASLQDAVGKLSAHADSWPPAVLDQYRALQAAARNDAAEAARTVAVLRNVLLRVPSFREDLLAIRTPAELIADPFDRFIAMPPSTSRPSPPDTGLSFATESLGVPQGSPAVTALAFSSDGNAPPILYAANDAGLSRVSGTAAVLPFPGGSSSPQTLGSAALSIDWNRDFRMDLVLAGAGGIRLLLQEADGTFRDATAAAAGADQAVTADCVGAWTADIEMDGDLDVVVGEKSGPAIVLRNNGDGTWRQTQPFAGVSDLRGFAWADVDGDGDPDAVLLDAQGNLHVFENRQGGQFTPIADPRTAKGLIAVAVADVNGDGLIDLVTLDGQGSVRRASFVRDAWEEQDVARWDNPPAAVPPGSARLLIADLDNNGSPDLVVSATGRSAVWLSGEGGFAPLSSAPNADLFAAVDLNSDGQLDLLGIANGQPARWLGRGTKGYHWQVVRPRAQELAGDQRINSFGIGGLIEVRSGVLTETQVITGTSVHFGLGTRSAIDVARIVWPNGVVQADFDSRADATVVAEQRLKGSCPWVFADAGSGLEFVTDFLWRSPLGLRINAQDTAGVSQTEDWVKIRANQLKPKDGSYDVRITAELWETHFVDHVSLMAVDHPSNLDVFVDERFAKEAPALRVHAMTPPRPIARAIDDRGHDVTDLVEHQDGRYLATFARGAYQGIAEDHFVEIDLGREITPQSGLWLVANGWIYPTDSSINVAIGQGGIQPRGIALEAQDASGHWTVVAPDLGFPAGKNKTILIDLTAAARAGLSGVRRIRLRTNLEIYWDSLAIAEDVPQAAVEATRIDPGRADLRYRGFSKTDFSRRAAPEIPRYNELANVAPRWRDLVGYYTRFGDVRELLRGVDDRYVIMNAGDELRLAFPAPAGPREGWTRDFVLIGDGWVKDGDFNTSYSKTVLPLPQHGHPDYTAASAALDLEEDPVYRHHAQDWQTYHTRFVAPMAFLRGLR